MSISRLDITVWLVAALLVSGTAFITITNDPQYAGASVAYLHPAYGAVENIWLARVSDPDNAVQLTDSDIGVFDFGVSPDGRYIAYAERRPVDTERQNVNFLSELVLLDLQTGETRQLTQCVAADADCRTPRFRADGRVIAYERQSINSALSEVGPGSIRIWLLDVGSGSTQPLTPDPQFVGYAPQWSADGDSIAFYSADIRNPGVMVYNFAQEQNQDDGNTETNASTLKLVPSSHGTVGSLAPNGETLVYPDITRRTSESTDDNGNPLSFSSIYTHLRIADLDALEFSDLTDPQGVTDDTNARWHPDGRRLAIERRYTDERYTPGYQIYLLDSETGDAEPLVYDPEYSHGFFEWNRTGDKLVLQRFARSQGSGNVESTYPGVWVHDMADDSLTLITENAFHPRWVTP